MSNFENELKDCLSHLEELLGIIESRVHDGIAAKHAVQYELTTQEKKDIVYQLDVFDNLIRQSKNSVSQDELSELSECYQMIFNFCNRLKVKGCIKKSYLYEFSELHACYKKICELWSKRNNPWLYDLLKKF